MAGSKSWQERLWRRAGLHTLGFRMEEYEKYIESEHWQAFRRLALQEQLKRHGRNFCQQCPPECTTREDTELHVHHITYQRLGKELIEDVAIICRPCHLAIHGRDARSHGTNYPPGYR